MEAPNFQVFYRDNKTVLYNDDVVLGGLRLTIEVFSEARPVGKTFS